MVYLVFLHIIFKNPCLIFEETYMWLEKSIEFDSKPYVFVAVYLENEFE